MKNDNGKHNLPLRKRQISDILPKWMPIAAFLSFVIAAITVAFVAEGWQVAAAVLFVLAAKIALPAAAALAVGAVCLAVIYALSLLLRFGVFCIGKTIERQKSENEKAVEWLLEQR